MHELSVAESIFRLAEEKITAYSGKRPVKINLEIGLFSGIDFEALEFAISSVVKNTLFEETVIQIDKVSPLARCNECQHEFQPEDYITTCPVCGNFNVEFLKGKELLIRSIELEGPD